ncbi:hypothetical protein CCR85_00585 [Rhodothalassium salexigens]|uniref:alpha/beta fold hydrolase n=1 Tax=Rhodothalassium salexigens TaxID=1086 RepID=UPI00191137A7|nr:hypothetical protein [Rhodothalassium salexigens]MBK5921602.1 hypothetical protein [Rhodothalassium salexigens]
MADDRAPTRFHEHTLGQGPVELVWLHGWGLSHDSLVGLARGLETRATNRLLDLPGFGATPMLAPGAGSADYAAGLAAHLGPKTGPRVLIGHSFGARVAVRLAAADAGACDALVLIAGAGIRPPRPWPRRLRAWMIGRLVKLGRLAGPATQERLRRRFGSADYAQAGPLRATLVSVVNENLTEPAAGIGCPVLLLYGAEDTETPPTVGEAYAAALPDGRLKVLPGFGHLDILSRGAHQCARHITRILDEIYP